MRLPVARVRIAAPLLYGGLLLAFCCMLGGCKNDQPQSRIDLSEPAAKIEAKSPDTRPVLNIAVAAMISPETTRACYEELLRLLADRVGRRAVFLQRRTYAEVNELVRSRQVDLAFVCSGPYTQGHAEFGMEILAVPVVHGVSVYHSYIIVHHDSPLASFDALRGHKFAFTDPNSNTGALVPTYMLARRGTTPAAFFRETFYSHSHDNSIRAVADGQSDGAAVDSLIWEFMRVIDPDLIAQTRVIEKSPPYGIPPIVVHPALAPELKAQLRSVFFALDRDPQGRTILAKLQIERFVAGDDASYDTVREMSRWLEGRRVN